MFWFILAIILFLAAVVTLFAAQGGFKAIGAGLAALGVLFAVLSVTYIVPPRTIGIPITLGKAGQSVGSGLHAKAPWATVEKMSASIQPLDASGDNPTIAKDKDKADIFIHNNVRWSIQEESASDLYMEYRDFDRISDDLVQPMLREAVAYVTTSYDPLGTPEEQPSNEQLAAAIQEKLQEKVGERINIHSVSVTLVDFSGPTKDRINALNTERGNTRIASQKEQTATKVAAANKALAESISNDPNVVVSNCVEAVGAAAPGTYPAGFQCWPGSGGSVVVPKG